MEFTATVAGIQAPRADIRILVLRPQMPFVWKAGQYVNIRFADFPPRAYSIANAPGALLEIHVRRGKGPVSAHVMETLKEGDTVLFTGPEGQSVYGEWIDGPVMALAGGLGIAPIRAIAEEAARRDFAKPFILYWSAASPCEHYIDGYFRALEEARGNFKFIPVAGPIEPDRIAGTLDDPGRWNIFISGPPAMIGAMASFLKGCGVKPEKIRYDNHPEAAGAR